MNGPSKFTWQDGDLEFEDDVDKFNPNHDELGRFSTGSSSGVGKWTEPSAKDFIAARNRSKRPEFLSPLSPDDLVNSDLFMSKDKTVGIALTNGDIGNVFNNGGHKGAAAEAIVNAVDHGGRTLDAYDGFLPHYYAQMGFVESGRMKFDPAQASPTWNAEKYDSPDIVFMAWKGYPAGGRDAAVDRASQHIGEIDLKPSTTYYDDWDAAKFKSRKDASP